MNNTAKIISAICALVCFLGSIVGFVYSFFIPHLGMAVVCAALAIIFSLFVYQDYRTFFVNK